MRGATNLDADTSIGDAEFQEHGIFIIFVFAISYQFAAASDATLWREFDCIPNQIGYHLWYMQEPPSKLLATKLA